MAVASGAATAFAQTPNLAVLSFITGVEADTNKNLSFNSPGTTYSIFETLRFATRAETNSQIFDFRLGTKLEFESNPGGGNYTTRFTEPNLYFLYSRDSANSTFSLSGDYWRGDVSSAFDADPSQAVLIVTDTGTLIRTSTNLSFQTGINDPLGFFFDGSYDTRGYTGTRNPSLIDSVTTDVDLGANFRFSQTFQGSASVQQINFSEQNTLRNREVDTTTYTLNLSHDLNSGLQLYGDFGYEDRVTSNRLASYSVSGYFGGIGFVQDRPNGTIFGSVDYDGTRFLDKQSLTFGRSLLLPDGSLSASLTLTNTDKVGVEYYGDLAYVRQTANGAFTVDLSRNLTTDQNYRDIIFSKVAVGYSHQINSASDINFLADFSRKEGEYFALIPVDDRATFAAYYSRAVTPEWDMTVGYRHRRYTSNNRVYEPSNSVFLTMTRDVEFGF